MTKKGVLLDGNNSDVDEYKDKFNAMLTGAIFTLSDKDLEILLDYIQFELECSYFDLFSKQC